MLIFKNRRYEKLIKKYKYHHGKIAITYVLLSLFIPVVILFLGIAFK